MSESAEGGAALAWRLLATLEGGSLLLAASALLAYSARHRARAELRPVRTALVSVEVMTQDQTEPAGGGSLMLAASALLAYSARHRARDKRRPVRTALVSSTSNALGKEIKSRLESRGCIVSVASDTSGAGAGAEADKVDALVVVGEDASVNSLDAIADLVSKDVHDNLKVLESLALRVHRGGYVAWACAGAARDSFRGAGAAFDTVLHASLQHVANRVECAPVWVGRHATAEVAARVVDALVPCTTRHHAFSLRNAAHKVSEYLGRWLKIVS